MLILFKSVIYSLKIFTLQVAGSVYSVQVSTRPKDVHVI